MKLNAMENNFKTKLYGLLKKDARLRDEKTKELNETLLKNLIDKLDEKLIELLLNNKEAKEKFFIKVKDIFVLKQNELKFFIDENKLDNSYTQYQNKIGLRVGNKLLSERNEVVLDWPFKDCVLEGGMTKEDQKRNEIFFNEVLAKDEIDRLEDPKALVNWKRYTAKGEKKLKEIKRNKDGIIKENLIIKGNNLLALHSLKEQFTGKVKLIYIDPPYNRDVDNFYNDNFKRSTWLTFMKNRLAVARQLLSDHGLVFVQIDDNQQAYLKILMDEVFVEENFVNCVVVKMSEATGVKMTHSTKKLPKLKEYLLVYKKNNINLDVTDILVPIEEMGVNYKNVVYGINNEEIEKLRFFMGKKMVDNKDLQEFDSIAKKVSLKTFDQVEKDWGRFSAEQREKWKELNAYRIVREVSSSSAKKIADEKRKHRNDNFFGIQTKENKLYFIKNHYNQSTPDPNIKLIFAIDYLFVNPCDFWNDIKTTRVDVEGDVGLKNGKKPEQLLKRIISISTKKGDIVLDYHLGSGTTCAVAHKMGRQFIGIEQLDYEENDSVVRLNNVIKGDQSGISKSLDWKGGGDFIYCELAKWNKEAKEKILNAKNLKELEKLFDELYERYFLNYNVKTKEFKKKILKEEGFKKLGLDEQKKLFVEMLDMNQMYVNFSERADKKYNLPKNDIALSEEFYNAKK